MTNVKRQYDLTKIKSGKTRRILANAATVAERLEGSGDRWAADAVARLIRSRIASQATNSTLAAELRAAAKRKGE